MSDPSAIEIDLDDLDTDPLVQFRRWFDDAEAAGTHLHDAIALATTDGGGAPAVRHVLLRGLDERGFVFYTNRDSRKGVHLAANPRAAFAVLWRELDRQVCVTGGVEPVSDEVSDAYFATRPRDARIGAWASAQSTVLRDRAELLDRFVDADARYPGENVPRPPYWGGYLVIPDTVEFWHARPYRLHDRFRYRRVEDGWLIERLSP